MLALVFFVLLESGDDVFIWVCFSGNGWRPVKVLSFSSC